MKKTKIEPVATKLDPNHPNHDAILLKRNRLEAHRRRRLENRGGLPAEDLKAVVKKPVKKSSQRRDA